MMRSTSFDFDTLEVRVERPTAYAEKPEAIRLKATKGRVRDQWRVQRNQVDTFNRLDTVAYRQSAPSLRRNTPPRRAYIIHLIAQRFS